MSQASTENTLNSRPSISALARTHGVHRRTVARRLKNGWDPAVKIVEQDQAVRRGAHPPAPVDLIALRRDIKEWTRLHNEVDRLKTRARGTERRSGGPARLSQHRRRVLRVDCSRGHKLNRKRASDLRARRSQAGGLFLAALGVRGLLWVIAIFPAL